MADSGERIDLSRFNNTVDKHSTGGVGDKTTLIVAPVVASLGCTVAKLSGRGLGHTGGTIDKLESVSGFRTDLTPEEFMNTVKNCGVCVSGAGANLAPADKKLYALRDVTATVSSIPLIVSSIMSKKLAGGSETIVLDVKTGSGAFMKTLTDSRALAEGMVKIGKLAGKRVSAVITDMDKPLGCNIGNYLEILEAVAVLKGEITDNLEPLYEVCVTLASEMVSRSKSLPYDECLSAVKEVIKNGKAYDTFKKWISLQGGNASLLEDPSYGVPSYRSEYLSPADGYVSSVNAEGIGLSAMMLGAGRATKDDVIDPFAGIKLLKNYGDRVKKGEKIAELLSNTVSDHSGALSRFAESIVISENKPEAKPTVYEIIR
jgi:pyrimidine-nucleoside phosphorylase